MSSASDTQRHVSWISTQKRPTEWGKCIECLQLWISFRKRATNHRAILWRMTYEDEASYASLPLWIKRQDNNFAQRCFVRVCRAFASFIEHCRALSWINDDTFSSINEWNNFMDQWMTIVVHLCHALINTVVHLRVSLIIVVHYHSSMNAAFSFINQWRLSCICVMHWSIWSCITCIHCPVIQSTPPHIRKTYGALTSSILPIATVAPRSSCTCACFVLVSHIENTCTDSLGW